MAWKSSFRQNYRTTFSPTVPPSAATISRVMADVEALGGESGNIKKAGESNSKLPLRTCPGCSVPEPYQSPDWYGSGLCPNWPKGWILIINYLNTALCKFSYISWFRSVLIHPTNKYTWYKRRISDILVCRISVTIWSSNFVNVIYTFAY
jgi:hypothetical protein